jgi:hypothetical protein
MPEPLVGPGQGEQEDDPHELVLALLAHMALQSCVPLGHWQLPPEHCLPPPHAIPQPPQLALSRLSSTQPPAHGTYPSAVSHW